MSRVAHGLLAHRTLTHPQRALPNAYWTNLGLQGFADPYRRLRDAT